MEVEHLDIVLGVDNVASSVEKLEQLADSLMGVWEWQQAVDENYHLDVTVDDRELDRLQRNLATTEAMDMAGVGDVGVGSRAGTAMASGGAVADGGGGGGRGLLDADDLARAMERFGTAVDADEWFRRGGTTDPFDLLEGDRTDHFDTEGILRAVTGGRMDADVVEDPWANFGMLQRRGLTDLPEQRGLAGGFKRWASDITMTDINNLLASLVPLLGAFIGALPAAIAGVVALAAAAFAAAGALVALGGLAVLGVGMGEDGFSMERVTQRLSEVRDIVVETLAPLAQRVAPLFDRAIDGLERFLEAMAMRGDVLLEFRDDAMALGEWLIQTLPPIIASMGRMADAASGVFAVIGDAFASIDWAGAFADLIAETFPLLAIITRTIANMLPAIIELSAGFLMAIASALLLIDVMGKLVSIIPIPIEFLGLLVGALLMVMTAYALAATASSLFAGTLISRVVSALVATIVVLGGVTYTVLSSFIPSILAGAAAIMVAATAVAFLTAGLSLLLGAAASVSTGFLGMSKDIRKATRQLKRFDSANSSLGAVGAGGAGGSGGGSAASRYVDVTNNVDVNAGSREDANAAGRRAAYRQEQQTDSYMG